MSFVMVDCVFLWDKLLTTNVVLIVHSNGLPKSFSLVTLIFIGVVYYTVDEEFIECICCDECYDSKVVHIVRLGERRHIYLSPL